MSNDSITRALRRYLDFHAPREGNVALIPEAPTYAELIACSLINRAISIQQEGIPAAHLIADILARADEYDSVHLED